MRWEDALAHALRAEGRSKLIAYAMGYRFLDGGPAQLTARERALRRFVSSIPDGGELSTDLRRDILALANATRIARRRLRWDLPPSWSVTEPEANHVD